MRSLLPRHWLFMSLFGLAATAVGFAANAPVSPADGDVLIDIGATKGGVETAAPVADAPVAKAAVQTPEPSGDEEKYKLGCDKLRANGPGRDEKEGFRLIAAAAQAGFPPAQAHLGRLHRDGVGTEKNYSEAIKWLRLACDAGLTDGAIDLGLLYFDGKGVHRDLVEAAALLSYASPTLQVAPPDAYPEARKALAALPGLLGPIEKEQVRERIDEERDRTLHRLMKK